MPSTLDSRNDPHDVLEIAPDVVLVARAAAEFPSLAPDATHGRSDRQPNMGSGSAAGPAMPKVDASFRATDTSGGRAHGGWARKVILALFALCSAVTAAAWNHYGDDAQAMVAGITPQIMPALKSWLPSEKPATASQADAAPAAENTAAVQTAPPAAAQPTDNATAAAATSPDASGRDDQLQLLQSTARDVASLTKQIEELKASVAELKTAQEQLSREKIRPPEPRMSEARPAEPRPTKLGAPPRPLGTLVQHRARPPAYPQAQSAYVPPPPPSAAPVQIAPPPVASPDGDPVVRPPMPVR